MILPDSGWFKALREAGLPFFALAAIVLTGLTSVWRLVPDLLLQPSFEGQAWVATGAAVCWLVALTWGGWLFLKAPRSLPGPIARWRLRRRYAGLTEQQKNFLRQVFRSGRRQFETWNSSDRWFEELSEDGFVEYIHLPIFITGTPSPYNVTLPAWKAMEQLARTNEL